VRRRSAGWIGRGRKLIGADERCFAGHATKGPRPCAAALALAVVFTLVEISGQWRPVGMRKRGSTLDHGASSSTWCRSSPRSWRPASATSARADTDRWAALGFSAWRHVVGLRNPFIRTWVPPRAHRERAGLRDRPVSSTASSRMRRRSAWGPDRCPRHPHLRALSAVDVARANPGSQESSRCRCWAVILHRHRLQFFFALSPEIGPASATVIA